MDIIERLDELAESEALRDMLDMQKNELIDAAIPTDVKERIAEIEAEFEPKIDSVTQNIIDLTGYIKRAVSEIGKSVKGARLHAVWSKGRISWNTRALDGYAAAHPEIEQFRKVGKPSVSIRKV